MITGKKFIQIHFRTFIFLLCFIGVQACLSNVPATASDTVPGAQQKNQNPNNLPSPVPPEPQFFCGYCHVITYPNIIQKSYELWKKDKHRDISCAECHYPPGKQQARMPKGSIPAHIPTVAPDRFSYLSLGGESVQTRPRIEDESCMTSACHGKPDDKFKTKKIKFTEKVSFVHVAHLDPKKQIEGQKLQCTSCHQHETDQKKFEVTKASCHQCHFTNETFNKGRAKCILCHELPEKPIQTSGEKPITHEMLQKAEVSCTSCHIDLIQATGGGRVDAYFEEGVLQTALTLGTDTINKGNCRSCHDRPEHLKEDTNQKLMHEKHVSIKNARCFDCHRPVAHTKSGTNPGKKEPFGKMSLETTIEKGCAACHPEPHQYQVMLAKGEKRKDVLDAIDPMYKVRTNCFGCHNESKSTENGQTVLGASGKTCVKCHVKGHDKMLEDWKKELKEEIEYSNEILQETADILTRAESKLSKKDLATARVMMKQGRDYMNMVIHGNGVHNKKYSIMLLDAAISSFDNVMDYVEDKQ